jgi:hypothetical protein
MEDDSPSKPRLRLAEAFEKVWSLSSQQRLDLERSIEEGVRKALGRWRGNGQEEWRELEARIDRLSGRVDALILRKQTPRSR